jgi:uncharacterized protein YndB with AHSA1/START domain
MSIKKDTSGKRWVAAEVEVPGTPEEVWQAIATGPGVSSWFVPTEKREDGTVVSHFGPGMDVTAKETAYEPLRRFAAESEIAPGTTMATEWTVETKAGGTCIVRVVHSLFASTDDWDKHLESIEKGWPDYFEILKLYLKHFRGQSCFGFQLLGMAAESSEAAWEKVATTLGLTAAIAGQTSKSANSQLQFEGVVERCGTTGHPSQALVRVHSPAPGLVHLFAMPMGKQGFVSVRFYLYGSTAEKTVSMQEPVWRAWIENLFPKTLAGDPGALQIPARIEARSQQKLSCSAEQLYDAWLDPEKIRDWMMHALKTFGLAGEMRRIETDPHVGGKFWFSDMRNGVEAVHVGEYLELVRPRKIVFTWIVGEPAAGDELPSKVTLSIEPDGSGCVATIVHEMDAK